MSSFKKMLAALQKAEEILMILAFAVMLASMTGSVIARNLLKLAIPWFDELARITMAYMVLLGAEAGFRDGSQVSVTAVTDMLKGNVKKLVSLIAKIVLVVFCAVVTVGSVKAMQNDIARNVTTTALNWPQWVPHASLFIGFGVATVVQTGTLIGSILKFGKAEKGGAE